MRKAPMNGRVPSPPPPPAVPATHRPSSGPRQSLEVVCSGVPSSLSSPESLVSRVYQLRLSTLLLYDRRRKMRIPFFPPVYNTHPPIFPGCCFPPRILSLENLNTFFLHPAPSPLLSLQNQTGSNLFFLPSKAIYPRCTRVLPHS